MMFKKTPKFKLNCNPHKEASWGAATGRAGETVLPNGKYELASGPEVLDFEPGRSERLGI